MFRQVRAIIKATTLEVVSEPLFFLLTISAVGFLTLASFLHVHQFGEPSRMARDVGFSSVLIFGLIYAVFAAIKSFRREIESGMLQMALSHPISRTTYFLAKTAGLFVACLVFYTIVFSSTITTVIGSEVAKVHAIELLKRSQECCESSSSPETLWHISLAVNCAVVVLPLVVGAFLNRFARYRFTTSASICAFSIALAGCFLNAIAADFIFGEKAAHAIDIAVRLISPGVLILAPILVFLSAAAAFSVRFKANAASSFLGGLFIIALPSLGNYYMTEAVARGGSLPWSYVALAYLAVLPFVVMFLFLGVECFREKDVG